MKNKTILLLTFLFFQNSILLSQVEELLPRGLSEKEKKEIKNYVFHTPIGLGGIDPPPGPVRAMAEWEELDGLIITWDVGGSGTLNILRQIVEHAQKEVNVIIVCSSATVVTNQLQGGGVPIDNITFVETDFNSIWVRDYGPNTVYDEVSGERYFIDWIYNRPRPADDTIVSSAVADALGVPLFVTDDCDNEMDMVHTGGNFMNDGMGTGFSSELILAENGVSNDFGCNFQDQSEVENIINSYMGIERYVFMDSIDFDPIQHIDMHMKLLDEETLLVGMYPEGVADGPAIEANLQYVLDNFQTPFGNEYDVIRIEMPSDNGYYPDTPLPNEGDYRTYTNAVFVNKTVLVPFYEEQFDTTAIRVWEEALPGYNIQGINSNAIIGLNGAIHCITKEVGSSDPLTIQTARVREGCMQYDQVVEAIIKHASGIQEATLYYTTDTLAGYLSLAMVNTSGNDWTASIPATNEEVEMFYYIKAVANSGKEIHRPLVAPTGHFKYKVKECEEISNSNLLIELNLKNIYPNPTSAITVIPVSTSNKIEAEIFVTDILGRTVKSIMSGTIPSGENNFYLHANELSAGAYFLNMVTEEKSFIQKLIVK